MAKIDYWEDGKLIEIDESEVSYLNCVSSI